MLDLFCGRLGWAKEFLARGWQVTAIDLMRPPELPEEIEFVQVDALQLRAWGRRIGVPAQIFGALWSVEPDFICASSSCEEFSVWGMRHFHKNPPHPENGIRLFNHTRNLCEASGIPYVMENVRAAQQFVGPAVNHAGSFYLWGSAVPVILPSGLRKGFRHTEMFAHDRTNRAHIAATIPPELANCVADYAERLLEQTLTSKPELSGSGPIPSKHVSEHEG